MPWIITEGEGADARERSVTVRNDDGERAEVEIDGVTYQVQTHTLPDGRVAMSGVGPDRKLRSWQDARGTWMGEGATARCLVVEDERSRWLGALAGGGGAGDGAVKASMPGRVVRLLVAMGDEVPPGGVVAVLEAMKMENDVKSASGGTVVEIAVSEGDAVEAGALLIRLEVAS